MPKSDGVFFRSRMPGQETQRALPGIHQSAIVFSIPAPTAAAAHHRKSRSPLKAPGSSCRMKTCRKQSEGFEYSCSPCGMRSSLCSVICRTFVMGLLVHCRMKFAVMFMPRRSSRRQRTEAAGLPSTRNTSWHRIISLKSCC